MERLKILVGTGVVFLFVLLTFPVGAELSCQWVEAKGEAAVENVTAKEAQQLALRGARALAVERVAGIEVQANVVVRDAVLAGQFLRSLAHGYVLKEEILRWERVHFQEAPDKPPFAVDRVYLRACVAPQLGRRDPDFTVVAKFDNNKTTFIARERASLKVQCTRDCYITIFNLAATDRFSIVLPIVDQPEKLQRARETLIFPPRGRILPMHTVSGYGRETGAYLIVATKSEFGAYSRLSKWEDIPMGEVFQVLLDLPASKRAETWLVYEVSER